MVLPPATGATSDARFGDAWKRALALAWEAFRAGITPVGAVIVSPDGFVVAAARGRRYEQSGPPGQLANMHVAHAEINALAQLGSGRFWKDHQLLTTLEPCGMCHGAAVQATVGAITFAAPIPSGNVDDALLARRRAGGGV